MMLDVDGVTAGYGETDVIRDISFAVEEGEITALVGPNGAGKTTLMQTLAGVLDPMEGRIVFAGSTVTPRSAYERVGEGLVLVSEDRNLFRDMTVRENLVLGSYTRRGGDRDRRLDEVLELFPRLADRREQLAGTLSGGEAQMLAIGRGLMADPDLLLLDEPSLGLAPKLIPDLFERVERINERGVAVVLVEQRVEEALELADTGHLLESGELRRSGSAEELLADETMIDEYLGGSA